LSENVGYIPNEIAIKNRDNDQQNHWIKRGTLFSDTPIKIHELQTSPVINLVSHPILKLSFWLLTVFCLCLVEPTSLFDNFGQNPSRNTPTMGYVQTTPGKYPQTEHFSVVATHPNRRANMSDTEVLKPVDGMGVPIFPNFV